MFDKIFNIVYIYNLCHNYLNHSLHISKRLREKIRQESRILERGFFIFC